MTTALRHTAPATCAPTLSVVPARTSYRLFSWVPRSPAPSSAPTELSVEASPDAVAEIARAILGADACEHVERVDIGEVGEVGLSVALCRGCQVVAVMPVRLGPTLEHSGHVACPDCIAECPTCHGSGGLVDICGDVETCRGECDTCQGAGHL